MAPFTAIKLTIAFVLALHSVTAAPSTTTSYDYIVVGGGTAGATLASRIAEDPTVTVILIEAGDDQVINAPLAFTPGTDVIGIGSDPDDTVAYDWGFHTTTLTGASNRKIPYARGKGLGGTSNRNFMLYQRPTAGSFEYWINATNHTASPGWTWDDVFPYFTKSVVLATPDAAARGPNNAPLYNPASYPETDPKKAPLPISFSKYVFDYAATLRGAFNQLGYQNATDFNAGQLNGVQFAASTIDQDTGHRATSQYFINNAISNGLTNLHVLINAQATKVNFDKNLNAVSVNYIQGSKTLTVSATQEIILSAGAFNSPHLLMLSGIGPAAQLKKYGIPVLVDLPGVGQNMQDHIVFSPAYLIKPEIYNFGHETLELDTLVNNLLAGLDPGPLKNPVCDFLGWQRVNDTYLDSSPELEVLKCYPPDWPHIEFLSAGGLDIGFVNLLVQNYEAALQGNFFYSLFGALIAPQSRGSVTLVSADPKVLPAIDPGYLTSPTDQILAVEIFRKIRRIFNTPSFLAARRDNTEYFPGYNVTSDADILNAIKGSLYTLWHAASTCAMQPRSHNGVLDPYLHVYGVTNLRVVDASSFPSLLPGHPQSVIYMLAERAADLIKGKRHDKITTTPRTPPAPDKSVPYTGPN